ncbi:hypothetical protein [Marinobacterium arenosum]|uniref:hypothetical protein n=1 Tax=Marinobacterium arenosum TaxID=2862496 RepID=UPI001C98C96A|nr:hypothetical protein [Marinobacterium arenosum]MBY4678949.1 hypothetical protein [Marinobacterium arenosum]
MNRTKIIVLGLLAFTMVGCAGAPSQTRLDLTCRDGISQAYDALSLARSKGFSGTVAWSKASALLAGAKVQEQVEDYAGCLDKVNKANFYIRQSQGL